MISTSKNGEINFYRAVGELKSLIENDGRNIVREQHTKQVEPFGKGRRKMKEDLYFLYDNNVY